MKKLEKGAFGSDSQFAGKGSYEFSSSGLSPNQLQSLQNQLLSAPLPPAIKNIANIKDLIKIKALPITNLNIGTLTAIKTATGIKSDFKIKSDLKIRLDMKTLLKDDFAIKTAQLPTIKSQPALKSQLKAILDLDLGGVGITHPSPTFRPPKIPIISTPIPTIPLAILLLGKQKQKQKKKGDDLFQDFGLLPDFTSRALGLSPDVLTQKQAKKRLKKILTGFEIRKGARLK